MVRTLKKMIEDMENSRISFQGLLVTFLSIVFLRNFLETFSDADNFLTPVSSPAFFIHYPLFYLCLFTALIVLLHILTGEKILRTTKIVFCFSPLILIAPAFDILFSHGRGFNMAYVFGDLPHLVDQYCTFFRSTSERGATPGIQVELLAAFSLVGTYVFIKTGKLWKSIAAVVMSYTIGFILGALPSIVSIVWKTCGADAGCRELFAGDVVLFHYYSFNHKMALVLLPVLTVECGLWLSLHDRRAFAAVIRNVRGLRVLHYLCMLGFGMMLGCLRSGSAPCFDSPFSFLILLAAGVSGVLAWLYAIGLNDLYDLKTDRISNPRRPFASGVLTENVQKIVNTICLLLSLTYASVIRHPFLLPVLVIIGISYIYSVPPLRLKRIPLLATFLIALCSLLIALAGFVLFSDEYSYAGFPPRVMLIMLLTITVAFSVKDIKDFRGDALTGCRTLPTLFGEKTGKQVVGLLVIVSYVSIPLILGYSKLLPVALAFGVTSFLLINRRETREGPVFITYFLYLGILAYSLLDQFQAGTLLLFG